MSFRAPPVPPWTLPLAGVVVAAVLVLAPLLLERGSRAASDVVEAGNATASSEPIQPLPDGLEGNALHVALGRRLFYDSLLSKDRKVSCASCHDLGSSGADPERLSSGVAGQRTSVNTPTVFNVAFSSRYGWTGARGTLAAQIHELAPNPVVMGTTWEEVAAAVARDASYAREFRAAFPEGATPANVRSALLEFTRSLVTPNAPFDRYLRGEESALSPAARNGYRLFRTLGCISCHQGANVGGNMFQTFGVMGDYFADRGTPLTEADQGRFAVTGRESDRHVFRVPSLRNVTRTAPYFHDGATATLPLAVQVMARYQLGRELSPDDVSALVAFLGSLSGELPRAGP